MILKESLFQYKMPHIGGWGQSIINDRRLIVLAGLVNIALGLRQFNESFPMSWWFYVVYGLWVFVIICRFTIATPRTQH
jgi:hypothetical protein